MTFRSLREIDVNRATSSGREDRISGIMVVISSFCIQVLVFGTSNSIGVYNVQFLKAFDAGAAAVSFVGSINLGMLLGAGPVSSFLLTKMSHRRVAVIGAVLSSIGLLSMPFATNLPYMYVFYGIIAGALIDYMNSQLAGITLSGFCTMFGGLVMVVLLIYRNTCRRKRSQQN